MIKRFVVMVLVLLMSINYSCVVKADSISQRNTIIEKTTYVPYEINNGKLVYYHKNFLYKKLKSGKYEKITKYKLENIDSIKGIYGKYIYFNNTKNKLCRIKYNGKYERKYKINAAYGDIISVNNRYIYYSPLDCSKGFLIRIKTNGKDYKKIICQGDTSLIKIYNNKIYYFESITDKNNSIIGKEYCKMDMDGGNRIKIYEEHSMLSLFDIIKDEIIIIKKDNEKVKVLKTAVESKEYKFEELTVFEKEFFDEYNYLGVFDNLLLFYKEKNNSIYSMNLDGKFGKFITDKKFKVSIVDGIGGVRILDDEGKYIIVPCENKMFLYGEKGNYIGRIKTVIKNNGIKYNQYQIILRNKKVIVRYKSKKGIISIVYKLKRKK